MSRLSATIRCDVRLQFRNGFYYAVAFILAGWAILVSRLPVLDWALLAPALLLGNLSMATFYFMGGLILLEKGEGTLEAQVVTPLKTNEYLLSKVVTLTFLSLVESLLIVTMLLGPRFHWLWLSAGVAAAAAIYALAGFAVVARYDSINEYLFPSVWYLLLLSLPYLHYFRVWETWTLYLHPLQGPLILMRAAFQPIPAWELVYCAAASALWMVVFFWIGRRAFARFVIAGEGVSR